MPLSLASRTGRSRVRGIVVAAACLATTAAAALLAQQNQADTVRNPLADVPAAATAGATLYNQTCQSCHGAGGQGDRGPALTTTALSHGNADADLFHTIREGIAGTQMPPFARLTDTQTWQLVSYVRSLQGEGTPRRRARPDRWQVTRRRAKGCSTAAPPACSVTK
jgi:mono/diheme cytochrome c family protein